MCAVAANKLSVEEYLALDRAAEIPSEYHDGEMFPINPVSWEHSFICGNLLRRVAERLDNKPCRVCASPTTADYDYGHKFILYRRIGSFEEYVLVAQDQARVEVFRKTPDRRWLISTYESLDAVANVESLGISLPLAEIYAGVELPDLTDEN
jgi:Uma2 family endonuclease